MADVPSPLFKLNYPIETVEARAFWSSNQKLNRIKAIIAFSLTLENANDNLRRYGYAKQFRNRALHNFGQYVNNPSMAGIPFNKLEDKWWIEMPFE